jgi:DNA polymerase V
LHNYLNSVQYSKDLIIFKKRGTILPRGGVRAGAGRPKGQGKFGEKTKPIRIPISKIDSVMNFINNSNISLPLYSSKVPAGFPSPADDHMEGKLDLNTHLVKHPTATFFVKASGDSMLGAGIHDGDILVVDRSLEPRKGKVVIAAVDGQLTVKRLQKKGSKTFLVPENKKFRSIELNENNDVKIWGVVTNVIHKV